MSKRYALTLATVAICTALSGCGKQTVQEAVDSAQAETVQDETGQGVSVGDTVNLTEEKQDDIIFEEAPEGYVYDYQVSLEPIPKEIADLGGPCQGTIHAFPGRIRIGLTEKMMEEDAELKADIEKIIPRVEECLKENIGGEFRVDGVDATGILFWEFLCTELDTGYQFYMGYDIWYNDTRYSEMLDKYKGYYYDEYYDKFNSEKAEDLYVDIINDNFEECVCIVHVKADGTTIRFNINQFTDKEVDKEDEQIKILNLWRDLNAFDDDIWYDIDVRYFPTIYRGIYDKKASEGILYRDFYIENTGRLIKNGELKASFSYCSLAERDNSFNLNNKLKLYDEGKYDKEEIWEYWETAE